jgi:hypothetical protein
MDTIMDDAPPPPLMMREFASTNMFSIQHLLSNELMNKIDQNCKLFVEYFPSRQCIGHYDKINMCMMLNGKASLSYYLKGSAIILANTERGAWVYHTIWQQQPLDGTRIVNTETNETSIVRIEHGEFIMSSE